MRVGFNDGMADIAPGVWVHRAARVQTSAIAGQGLFLTAPVAAGEPLIHLGGRIVSTDELHRLFERAEAQGRYVDTFAIDIDTHLVLPPDTRAHYVNHSCDPSLQFAAPLELAARDDLPAGAELTLDYAVISDDPTFRMECTCAALTCRRIVAGSDWQRPDLQAAHEGRWPTGLQRRIDEVTSSWEDPPQHGTA